MLEIFQKWVGATWYDHVIVIFVETWRLGLILVIIVIHFVSIAVVSTVYGLCLKSLLLGEAHIRLEICRTRSLNCDSRTHEYRVSIIELVLFDEIMRVRILLLSEMIFKTLLRGRLSVHG